MIPAKFTRSRWYLFTRQLFCYLCEDWRWHQWDFDSGAYVCLKAAGHPETSAILQEFIRLDEQTERIDRAHPDNP